MVDLAQEIDNTAIEEIAKILEQNHSILTLAVNKDLTDDQKLKAADDPQFFKDGQFSKADFDAYELKRAEEIYKGESAFAKATRATMKSLAGEDPNKKGMLDLLENHTPISAAIVHTVEKFEGPIPIPGMDMGVSIQTALSGIGTFISNLFSNGFDFGAAMDATKKSIADQAVAALPEELAAQHVDPLTSKFAIKKAKDILAKKLGLPKDPKDEPDGKTGENPADKKASEIKATTLANTKIDGQDNPTAAAQPSASSATPGAQAGESALTSLSSNAANANAPAATGAAITFDAAIDAAIQKTKDDSNTKAVMKVINQQKPEALPIMEALERNFTANAKVLGSDITKGQPNAPKDAQTFADTAFKKTLEQIKSDPQKAALLGLDKVDTTKPMSELLVALKNGTPGATAQEKIAQSLGAQVLEKFRNNMMEAYTNATQNKGATVQTPASGASSPTATTNPPADAGQALKDAQGNIKRMNDEAIALVSDNLDKTAREGTAVKIATQSKLLGMWMRGIPGDAREVVRKYVKETYDEVNGDKVKRDGTRGPTPAETKAINQLYDFVSNDQQRMFNKDQLALLSRVSAEAVSATVNNLVKEGKPVPPPKELAAMISNEIQQRLGTATGANGKKLDQLGPSIAQINANLDSIPFSGKYDLMKSLSDKLAQSLIEDRAKHDETSKEVMPGAYAMVKKAYETLTPFYEAQKSAEIAVAVNSAPKANKAPAVAGQMPSPSTPAMTIIPSVGRNPANQVASASR